MGGGLSSIILSSRSFGEFSLNTSQESDSDEDYDTDSIPGVEDVSESDSEYDELDVQKNSWIAFC